LRDTAVENPHRQNNAVQREHPDVVQIEQNGSHTKAH